MKFIADYCSPCSGVEGWEELEKQREDGERFVIDLIAARVHAGWAQATQSVRIHKMYFIALCPNGLKNLV
jgi:hypothetical protein